MEEEVKQYIIVRMDLPMSVGKIAAQATHAAKKVWFDKFQSSRLVMAGNTPDLKIYKFVATPEEVAWIEGKFTTIIKRVKNESQLMKVYNQAKEAGLNVSLIKDAGLTELEGENHTCIAVGPNYVDRCEPYVKKLQNLNYQVCRCEKE